MGLRAARVRPGTRDRALVAALGATPILASPAGDELVDGTVSYVGWQLADVRVVQVGGLSVLEVCAAGFTGLTE
jgi:hypothetical protein